MLLVPHSQSQNLTGYILKGLQSLVFLGTGYERQLHVQISNVVVVRGNANVIIVLSSEQRGPLHHPFLEYRSYRSV